MILLLEQVRETQVYFALNNSRRCKLIFQRLTLGGRVAALQDLVLDFSESEPYANAIPRKGRPFAQ